MRKEKSFYELEEGTVLELGVGVECIEKELLPWSGR